MILRPERGVFIKRASCIDLSYRADAAFHNIAIGIAIIRMG